ncbi:MAG: hypothetical protein ACE5KE_00640 [Methanosarcinales archaeon]
MVMKRFCDKCGEEIEGQYWKLTVDPQTWRGQFDREPRTKEFCERCFQVLEICLKYLQVS